MSDSQNGPRFLLAGIDPKTVAYIRSYLEKAGYEVATVETGQQAWEALQSQPFDLLATFLMLKDVSDGGMIGIELIHRMRATEELKDVPALLLTSLPNDIGIRLNDKEAVTQWERQFDEKGYRKVTVPCYLNKIVERVKELLAEAADGKERNHEQ